MITTMWRKPLAMNSCYGFMLTTLFASSLMTACTPTQKLSSEINRDATIVAGSSVRRAATAPTLTPPNVVPGDASKLSRIAADQRITLEKIMSDPDWMGRRPESANWSLDNQSVYFAQKRQGSVVREQYQIALDTSALGSKDAIQSLEFNQYFRSAWRKRVVSADNNQIAWLFKGDIYLQQRQAQDQFGDVVQLTRGIGGIANIQFLSDGLLAYQIADRFYVVDADKGTTSLLADWRFATKPLAVEPADDYIAAEQQKLIKYVQTRRQQRQQRDEFNTQMREHINASPTPFYLPKGFKTEQVSLSPTGDRIILMLKKQEVLRNDTDIMPHYIQEDGRIAAIEARRRVADAKPTEHQLWYLDIQSGKAKQLQFSQLPGFNDDVLAEVKRENAAKLGTEYTTNRLPRNIHLQMNWGTRATEIAWHNSGEHVAIMLEAWDNKDRWLVTVDFEQVKLITQHRLHDDAWIGYRFNEFGWLNQSDTLYFVSEENGYANLYTKSLAAQLGQHKALVTGEFEIANLQLSQRDDFIYFEANRTHPGVYEVFRVDLATGDLAQLTQLNGLTRYDLSPDESQLLLTHSTLTMPPELYVKSAQPGGEAIRLTHTVSDEFLALPWIQPDLVAVPSSHTSQPIYARVYQPTQSLPSPQAKRRAVIFNHGAGYLQNAHAGWSVYFREFMFHSMLAQQGYVVMDMDYRASQGYGRDWRTAIYRHMGKPEIEDLEDGVNWLVTHANVDSQRVGTYGGSYGGFMTFMALFTKPDLFQAGAAMRPVSDWAHYNEEYTSNILNTPDVDPIAYQRSSPLYFAEGLQKPLLINAPMVDDNVFFVDVVRLVQRLIELEKQDFETAIYPVEPHSFRQPSSWLDEYRRIYRLFETHL